jgi:hypothetical protein
MHRPTLPTLIAIGAVLCLLASIRALAGSTDPTLAIGQLRARPAGQTALLELTGIFGFDDVLQMDFPVTVVAWQGDTFVRFRPGAAAQSGSFAQLSDGLQISEIAALESAGTDNPDAEILSLEPNKLLMAMPPIVFDGTIHAVLYVSVPGEGTFVSNALSTTLVGVGGGS